MLRVSSKKYVEARARQINIVTRVNVVSVSGLEPPVIEPVVDDLDPAGQEQLSQPPQMDSNTHPFFWMLPGQKVPQEIRWIWDPISGDMYVGTQDRHSEMTPSGTDWSAVLRGFYFPDKKLIAIRPYFWPDGANDYWDGDHAELSADIQITFIMAMKPILQQQDPEVDFQTNIDNSWLQSGGRYSW